MRFRHTESILRPHLIITETPQNVHKVGFWANLITFSSDVKIDLIMFKAPSVKFFFYGLHPMSTFLISHIKVIQITPKHIYISKCFSDHQMWPQN